MISPTNPVEVTPQGVWRWTPGNMGGSARFYAYDHYPDGGVKAAGGNTSSPSVPTGPAAAGNANNSINLNAQSNSVNSTRITQPMLKSPKPAPPDYSRLNALADTVQRNGMIKEAMTEYDELEAATRATGMQTANNAGTVYANRMMQAGMNPLASGVVAAQAKLPVYRQLAEIGVEKEKTRLDASSRADALAAQIAANIAQLQLGYTKTLADFNQQNVGYELDMAKFNAGQFQRDREFGMDYELRAADLAMRSAAASAATTKPKKAPYSGPMELVSGGGGSPISIGAYGSHPAYQAWLRG